MKNKYLKCKNQNEIINILNKTVRFDSKSTSETFEETAKRYKEYGRELEASEILQANIRWWQIEEPGKYDDDGNIIDQ